VELATLEWASWFNNYRLMAPLGYVPPVEANYYHSGNLEQQAMPA
jgi:putative transposase